MSTQDVDWTRVFDALGHPTLLLDADRTIVAANQAAQLAYGQNRVQLRGAKCFDLICGRGEPPADCPAEEFFSSAAVEPSFFELEALGRHFQVVCAPVIDDSGHVTHVVHAAIDLTDHKRIEASLRQTEERYQLLSDHVSDFIFTTDLRLRWTYVSPSVERLRGYTAEETMAQSTAEVLTPRSLERAKATLGIELLKEQTEDPAAFKPYVMDLEFTCKDGSTVWAESKMSFLRDEEGRPTGICGVARDITERRAAQTEREHLETQLHHAQRMEAVGRLAGGVAHDFNNMLSVIMGYTALLRGQTAEAGVLKEDLDEIEQAIDRAAELTRQLLTFSRRQISSPVLLSLNTVVSETERMLRRIVGEDIELAMELADDLAPIHADRAHLEQVLVNLAVNARDAMPRGGRLSMRTANADIDLAEARRVLDLEPGTYVLLEVTDTGVGMPPSVLERVFEPFYTTKENGKGTGLGLSTVYGIVKQSGGHVFVESAPRQGTKFSLYFPKLSDEARPAAEPRRRPSAAPRGTTVLLVEDEAPLRKLVRRTLENQGHRVLEAEHADQALQLVEQHEGPIDVLLTDLILPGPTGKALAEQLSAVRPELRVVYMSGHSDEIVAEHGMLEEGIVFLPKPFGPPELAEKIAEALAS